MRGEKLLAADSNGTSDPWVNLRLGTHERKSRVVPNTLDPVWDESFDFKGSLHELTASALQLHCWDSDLGGMLRDDLGTGTADLTALSGSSELHCLVPLSKGGQLILHCSWLGDPAHGAGSAASAGAAPAAPVQATTSPPPAPSRFLTHRPPFFPSSSPRALPVRTSLFARAGNHRRARLHLGGPHAGVQPQLCRTDAIVA